MNRLLLVFMLLWALVAMAAGPPPKSIVLQAVEDTYLVTDVSTTEDPEGYRDQNFGGLDFIRIWYKSKVTAEEQIVSVGLVKFDLAPLKGLEVESANLQMFAQRVDLAEPARLVDVTRVNPAPWAEKEVTFNKRPEWSPTAASLVAVFGNGRWYSWDVTGSVTGQKEPTVSYVLGLRTVEEKKEEQVVFNSREAGSNAPRLVVTYTEPPFAVAWWAWVAAIVAGVIVAFIAGIWLARRVRVGRGA